MTAARPDLGPIFVERIDPDAARELLALLGRAQPTSLLSLAGRLGGQLDGQIDDPVGLGPGFAPQVYGGLTFRLNLGFVPSLPGAGQDLAHDFHLAGLQPLEVDGDKGREDRGVGALAGRRGFFERHVSSAFCWGGDGLMSPGGVKP